MEPQYDFCTGRSPVPLIVRKTHPALARGRTLETFGIFQQASYNHSSLSFPSNDNINVTGLPFFNRYRFIFIYKIVFYKKKNQPNKKLKST